MLKHSKVNPPKPDPNLSRNPCFVVNFNPFYKMTWLSPKGMGSDSGIMHRPKLQPCRAISRESRLMAAPLGEYKTLETATA